jgi:hypothetical protein
MRQLTHIVKYFSINTMSDIFHQKIDQSLANPVLHAALDANARRRK